MQLWTDLSSSLRRLIAKGPPARVWVGSLLALLTFVVSNQWKADVDSRIGDERSLIARIQSIEKRLDAIPTTISFLDIATAISEQQKSISRSVSILLPGDKQEMQDWNDFSAAESVTTLMRITQAGVNDLTKTLPLSAKSLPLVEEYRSLFTDEWSTSNDPGAVRYCIKQAPAISEAEKSYKALLVKYYQSEVKEYLGPNSDTLVIPHSKQELMKSALVIGPKDDLDDILMRQRRRFSMEINLLKELALPDDIWQMKDFGPYFFNPPSGDLEQWKAKANLLRKHAFNCIKNGQEWGLQHVSDVLKKVRSGIEEQIIKPLELRKTWIGRVEAFLYFASSLLALVGATKDARSTHVTTSPFRQSAAELDSLRKLKSKPMHRRKL